MRMIFSQKEVNDMPVVVREMGRIGMFIWPELLLFVAGLYFC